MLGVKITALLLAITVVYCILLKTILDCCSDLTKMQMAAGIYPKWTMWMGLILLLLIIDDCIGCIWSVVYLLFLR